MAPPVPRPAVFQGNRPTAPAAAAAVTAAAAAVTAAAAAPAAAVTAAAAGKVAGSGAATGVGGHNNRQRQGLVSQITPPSPVSGVSGPTPVSQAGFRRLVPGKGQQLTLLSIEVHADTRYASLQSPDLASSSMTMIYSPFLSSYSSRFPAYTSRCIHLMYCTAFALTKHKAVQGCHMDSG